MTPNTENSTINNKTEEIAENEHDPEEGKEKFPEFGKQEIENDQNEANGGGSNELEAKEEEQDKSEDNAH